MSNKINMYKMYTGGIVIGEVVNENDDNVTLSNPRIVSPQMTMSGYALVLTDIVPYKVLTTRKIDEVTINKMQIMVTIQEDDIIKDIINEYRSDVSGIDIVSGVNADLLKKEPTKGGDIII